MSSVSVRVLAAGLDTDLLRWLEEVSRDGVRSTLQGGILGRSVAGTENLLRQSVTILRAASPAMVDPLLDRLAPNKSLNMLTFGQLVKVIEQVAKLAKLSAGGSLAAPPELRRLNRLAKIRNDQAHGRLDLEREKPITEEFLKAAHELCTGSFVDNLHRLESAQEILTPRRPLDHGFDVAEIQAASEGSVQFPVVVGNRYLYTEDDDKLEVRVLADESTADALVYRIEVTKVVRGDASHQGQTYTVEMRRDVRFAGMWALHPIEN